MFDIGGAIDRLYQGSGYEACEPLLEDYFAVVNAPVLDVSGQPSYIQTAYALYRDALTFIADPNKVDKIRVVYERGGGTLGNLDFDVARIAVNDSASRLGQALQILTDNQ